MWNSCSSVYKTKEEGRQKWVEMESSEVGMEYRSPKGLAMAQTLPRIVLSEAVDELPN